MPTQDDSHDNSISTLSNQRKLKPSSMRSSASNNIKNKEKQVTKQSKIELDTLEEHFLDEIDRE